MNGRLRRLSRHSSRCQCLRRRLHRSPPAGQASQACHRHTNHKEPVKCCSRESGSAAGQLPRSRGGRGQEAAEADTLSWASLEARKRNHWHPRAAPTVRACGGTHMSLASDPDPWPASPSDCSCGTCAEATRDSAVRAMAEGGVRGRTAVAARATTPVLRSSVPPCS